MGQTTRVFTKALPIAVALCVCGVLACPAQGQCEIAKLLASDGTADDNLGFSVAISGDRAIAGAPLDGKNGFWSGSAYIYRFDPETSLWIEEAKLLASDGATNDAFGWSVAIDGDIAAVGAYADDDGFVNSGSAYVYRYDHARSQWIEEAKLLASDAAISAWFGFSVAISADVVVVGAAADDENGPESGAAYVFRYDPDTSNWLEETKLLSSDGQEADFFGAALASDGDLVIVGSFAHDDNGKSSGAAYIFRFDPKEQQWNEEAELLDPDGATFDLFGRVVDIFGDLAIAGVPKDDDNGTQSGSALIFRFDPSGDPGAQWTLEAKLLASDGVEADSFGSGVAIGDEVAVVGASGHDANAFNSGSAYVFRFDPALLQWTEVAEVVASDVVENHGFGGRVALSGNLAIMGAHGDDDNGPNAGSAYLFTGIDGVDCNNNGEADACDIFNGRSSDLNSNNVPDECDADLDGDGSVGVTDLLILLANWGPCRDCNTCSADLDGDCSVGVTDLIMLLSNWGS